MNPLCLLALGLLCLPFARAQEAPSNEQVAETMLRAVRLFREQASVHGSYVWQYSPDFKLREGEGKASSTQGWMQPPGTPAVGMALLDAWQATGDEYYLDAARETGGAILRGQLGSGGWHYMLEFDPAGRKKIAYRVDGGGGKKARNVTTLDDDVTQSALRFLVRLDAMRGFSDERVLEAVSYAIEQLAGAQYPNGAWPQAYDELPESEGFPVRSASYPTEWTRAWPASKQYWLRYTLNDGVLTTLLETLLEVAQVYGSTNAPEKRLGLARRAKEMAMRAGDFLLLAQMPEPQPAWAQQYDFDIHPAWARKFEPPAITGGESQDVLRALMALYRATGIAKYLEPIPRALAYLRESRLENGRLARFYELESNRPLYFTRDYQLTHSDADLPTHYAFTVTDQTDSILKEFTELLETPWGEIAPTESGRTGRSNDDRVRGIIADQDERGAWVEPGRLRSHGQAPGMVIRTDTFNKNIMALAHYLILERRAEEAQSSRP